MRITVIKKSVIYCIISLILSVFTAYLIQSKNMKMTPGFCADVCAHGEWIYGIDYDAPNKKVCVYRVDRNGKNLSRIPLDAQSSDSFYHYDTLYYDPKDGELYFYVGEFQTSSGILIGEKVCRCDFEDHTYEIVWTFPLNSKLQKNKSVLAYRIEDRTLEYLTNSGNEYAVNVIAGNGESSFVRKISCCDNTELSLYNFDSQGKVCGFSYAAGMYYESDDSLLEPVSGKEDVWSSFCDPIWRSDGSIVCTDLRESKIKTYNIKEQRCDMQPLPQTYSALVDGGNTTYEISQNMLTSIGEADDGYAVYVEIPEEIKKTNDKIPFRFGVGICKNKNIDLLSVLCVSFDDAVKMVVKNSLFFMGIALFFGLIILVIYWTVNRTGFVSVRMEMAVFGLITFGLSVFIMSKVLSKAMIKLYETNYTAMRTDLQKSICAELDNMIEQYPEFDDSTPYTKDFHDKLGRIMPSDNEFNEKSEVIQPDDESVRNPFTMKETFIPYFLFHIVDKNGDLVILYNDGEIEHVPTDRLYHNSYLYSNDAEFASVLQNQKIKAFEQYDTYGTWNVQLFYYENAEHDIRGVIEIGVNNYMTNWKMKQAIMQAIIIEAISFFVMAAIILLYMGSALAPIKKLGIQVKNGSVDIPRNKRWSMEIRRIWELLYVLINRGAKQQQELEKNDRERYRFFSQELTELFGKQELIDINTDTRRQCHLQIVHAVFKQPAPDHITALTAELTDMCRKKGGILLAMDMYHAIWVFINGQGKYIEAAQDVLYLAKKHCTVCGVGIGNGICTLHIRGDERNAEAALSGTEAENTAIIAEYAAKNGQMCLMTSSAAACFKKNAQLCEHKVREDILCFEYISANFDSESKKTDQSLVSDAL